MEKKKSQPIKYVTPLQVLIPKFGDIVAIDIVNTLELYCRRHKEIVSGYKEDTYGCIIFDRSYGYIESVSFGHMEEKTNQIPKSTNINKNKLNLANKILQDFFSLPNQPKPAILKEDIERFSKILDKYIL